MHRIRLVAAATLAAGMAGLPSTAVAKETVTMSGSTSVAPLATALAKKYVKQFPGKLGFKILQGGSDIGIVDASKGRVSIGMVARDPLSGSDPKGMVFNKIARDGVCIVTNPGNPIASLSQKQIQAVFSGQVRNWKDIPGAKVSGAIDLVSRTAASGTADAFQNIFMGPDLRIASSAATKTSNGLVQQSVSSNKNAIGFVSFDFIGGLNAAAYNGVACTLRNAKSGQYAGVRNFWMVTRGKAAGGAAKFIKWIQNDKAARKIVSTNWIALK